MGLFSHPTPYKGQNYSELKKQALESGHPFIDQEFPPDEKALFHTGGKMSGVEWKRPKDICEDPQLFVDGASSNDLNQGELGNCWFVAACSCLATSKTIWSKVIPDYKEQEWQKEETDKYAGIFHFNFWRFGEWVDVVIDDFLPTRGGKLVYVHSKSRNEFWSALLEKAYAKLFGSYEALDGGELSEALEDFTGGVAEPIDMVAENYGGNETSRDELFKMLKHGMDNKALMAAAIPAKSSEEMEQSIDVGLVKGHAYGITAVKRVALEGTGIFNMFNKEKLAMIRLRNPWGGTEWKGSFSDGSDEWNKIDKASRDKIGLTFEDDGEFWMTFEDYCRYFTNMSICRVLNKSFFSLQKSWYESELHSEWKAPHRAGGCINNRETVLQNPQFGFDITESDEECLLELIQKSSRADKKTIGFTIMKVEENRRYRCHKLQEVVKSSSFKNSRGIFLRHTLQKGRYVLITSTFEPGIDGLHLMRVYTGGANNTKELLLDKPEAHFLGCLPCWKYPTTVTRIKCVRAVGLEHHDRIGGADPYCFLICEGHKYRSRVVKDSLSPEWNNSFLFFRRNPMSKPIEVQIWNSNPIKDDFMGKHIFQATEDQVDKTYEVALLARKSGDGNKPGKLYVQITTSRDLMFL